MGLMARKIASSLIPSLQKGFQLAGPRTVGGPSGRAMTPAEGGTSSMAFTPPLSGVRSSEASSLMANTPNQTKKREPLPRGRGWAHNPLKGRCCPFLL